jgi:hypothetical protein
MRSKAEMMTELQRMLRDILAASSAGTRYTRVARAHGYIDGYMRALLDLDVATQAELVEVVAVQRERIGGPATRVVEFSPDEIAVA